MPLFKVSLCHLSRSLPRWSPLRCYPPVSTDPSPVGQEHSPRGGWSMPCWLEPASWAVPLETRRKEAGAGANMEPRLRGTPEQRGAAMEGPSTDKQPCSSRGPQSLVTVRPGTLLVALSPLPVGSPFLCSGVMGLGWSDPFLPGSWEVPRLGPNLSSFAEAPGKEVVSPRGRIAPLPAFLAQTGSWEDQPVSEGSQL